MSGLVVAAAQVANEEALCRVVGVEALAYNPSGGVADVVVVGGSEHEERGCLDGIFLVAGVGWQLGSLLMDLW
jgi:hypothetical protein